MDSNHNYKSNQACTYYILSKCCKKVYVRSYLVDLISESYVLISSYKNIDFIDYKWIVDRCNFELSKNYGINCIDNKYVSFQVDSPFVPEFYTFDNGENYKDYISIVQKNAMDKIIRQWKIYGRIFVKIDDWLWKLKTFFKRNKSHN